MSDVVLPAAYPSEPAEAANLIRQEVVAVLAGERDPVANMANVAAILGHAVSGINWVGFYVAKGKELVLGPFWGLPACVRVGYGRGVCGTAWKRGETVIVDDVQEFPGHIACDARSRSEIVVPLIQAGGVRAVLDCDAPSKARFGPLERELLEAVAQAVAAGSDFSL